MPEPRRIVIEFEVTNASFEDKFFEEVRAVLGQAYRKLMDQAVREVATHCDAPEASDILKDTNGNTIGTVGLETE